MRISFVFIVSQIPFSDKKKHKFQFNILLRLHTQAAISQTYAKRCKQASNTGVYERSLCIPCHCKRKLSRFLQWRFYLDSKKNNPRWFYPNLGYSFECNRDAWIIGLALKTLPLRMLSVQHPPLTYHQFLQNLRF